MTQSEKIISEKIQKDLFSMQDIPYRDFQAKLIPTVDSKSMIGVRTPSLRSYAKTFSKNNDAEKYLKILPHKYYEEYNLHGFMIETIKDFDKAVNAVNDFLPYVNNWATCDLVSPKVFKKFPEKILPHIKKWIASEETFTIRFGIEMLMSIFLDDNFSPIYLTLVSKIKSSEYYVNMMIAWYFATALAKQYDSTLPFIQNQIGRAHV